MQRAVTLGYGPGAKLLHWLIAVLVLILVGIGLGMTRLSLPLDVKFGLYQLHKSLGFVVGALMALRLGWRLTHPAPSLPLTMPALERAVAHLAHVLIYALLFLLPVTGWLLVSSASFAVATRLFGVIPVPHLPQLADLPIELRRPYEDLFKSMHHLFAYALIALVIAHVLAALRHHFVLQDDVLTRMLPGARSRAPALLAGLALGTALALGGARAADAPAWTVDPAASKIAFEASAGGQAITGAVGAYKAMIRFDPADPASTDVSIEMDAHSISTGNSQVDQALASADWFDADGHPTVTFAAKSAKKTGEGTYELDGTLTIKGTAKPVTLSFLLTLDGDIAKAQGTATVSRLDFGLGSGIAADAAADAVKVTLSLMAKRG